MKGKKLRRSPERAGAPARKKILSKKGPPVFNATGHEKKGPRLTGEKKTRRAKKKYRLAFYSAGGGGSLAKRKLSAGEKKHSSLKTFLGSRGRSRGKKKANSVKQALLKGGMALHLKGSQNGKRGSRCVGKKEEGSRGTLLD